MNIECTLNVYWRDTLYDRDVVSLLICSWALAFGDSFKLIHYQINPNGAGLLNVA